MEKNFRFLFFVQWQLAHSFYFFLIRSNHDQSHDDEKNEEGEKGDAWKNPDMFDR
jgi:hypothetical protein